MAAPGTGFSGLAFIMLFAIFLSVTLVLPVTLNSDVRNATLPPAPMGNELQMPAGALALGASDMFTQRICPSSNELPARATNERLLSNEIFDQVEDIPEPRGLNALTWGMGQFIDHDVILSVNDDTLAGDSIEMVPSNGTFLDLSRVERRLNAQNLTETRNLLSAHLDLSTVYGDYKNPTRLDILREEIEGIPQCRLNEGPNGTPMWKDGTFYCGDKRCAETLLLSSMHALFLREHNRLCAELASRYPWTQEQLFWKARSLNIAYYQHIVYSEWLPTLFGTQSFLLNNDGQGVETKGEYTRISTEFGVVAFRFGHTMVGETLGDLILRDLFFNPNLTIARTPDSILLMGAQTPSQKVDNKVVQSLRNFLFTTEHFTVSEDLVTRNLYRAREINMASYEELCACFGTPPVATPIPNTPTDPIPGLFSEPLVSGSSLPSTLARILAEQFKRLRDNDEFFYTKDRSVTQLTLGELYAVRLTRMHDIIVRNTQLDSSQIKANAFYI